MNTDVHFREGPSAFSLLRLHKEMQINGREAETQSKKKISHPPHCYSFLQTTKVISQAVLFWSTCQVFRMKNNTFCCLLHPSPLNHRGSHLISFQGASYLSTCFWFET